MRIVRCAGSGEPYGVRVVRCAGSGEPYGVRVVRCAESGSLTVRESPRAPGQGNHKVRWSYSAPGRGRCAPRPRSLLRSHLAARSLIWKYVVKGVGGRRILVGSAARGRGQDVATVITLIFAGQQSRGRMTVSRHRGIHRTSGRGSIPQVSARGFSAISASPDREQRCPPDTVHAAAGTSWSTCPAAQMKPANSRAMAVSALSAPMRRLRWRKRVCSRS